MPETLRMFLDTGAVWPFWSSRGQPTPQELGLDEGLTRDIRVWCDLWEQHSDEFAGWDSESNEEAFLAAGPTLRDRVQTALGDDYEVVLISDDDTAPITQRRTVREEPSQPAGHWVVAKLADRDDAPTLPPRR